MTKAYLDASQLRPTKLVSAISGSLVFSSDMGETEFLVGSGDDPYVIVLNSDQQDLSPGSAWNRAESSNWTGLEVTGLAIRIDATSRIRPRTARPMLSILRSADRLYVNCRPPEPTGQRIVAEVANELPVGWGDLVECFTRWQLVSVVDGVVTVVHSVDVTPNQTPAR